MAVEGEFELTFHKTIGGVSQFFTWTQASAGNRVMSPKLYSAENYPSRLELAIDNTQKVAAENLLSDACALWDAGTGSLDVGDRVSFSLPLKATGVMTQIFHGVIASLKVDNKGVLRIVAVDWLAALDSHREDVIVFDTYRDQVDAVMALSADKRYYLTAPDSNAAYPFVQVEATGDYHAVEISNTKNAVSLYIAGPSLATESYLAQAFIPDGDVFLGCAAWVEWVDSLVTDATLMASLHESDSIDSAPLATALWSKNITILRNSDQWQRWEADTPLPVKPGKVYWLRFECVGTYDIINLGTNTVPQYRALAIASYNRCLTGTWTTYNDVTLACQVGIGRYVTMPSSEYALDATDPTIIYLLKPPTPLSEALYSIPGTLLSICAAMQGRLSYYYGSIPSQYAVDDIADLAGLTAGWDASLSALVPLPLFRTRGKTHSEALRELLDQYVFTKSSVPVQAVMYADMNVEGGTRTLFVAPRKALSDASAFTFSYAPDTATDSERVIISADLEVTSKRPSAVMVVGKSSDGFPLCAYRDDRPLGAGSFFSKSGMPTVTRIVDESINTLEQADKVAWAMLDHYARDEWEGRILLSGCYPDVFANGSGEIITLNYSPMGISGLKLKVKSAVVGLFGTEITVSNIDQLLENKLQASITRGQRSELFNSPEYQGRNVFSKVVDLDANIDTAALYMALISGADEVTSRVKCVRFLNEDYECAVYHAEFEQDDRTVDASAAPVDSIALYDAASGGSLVASESLTGLNRVWKWQTTRVIVDYLCWSSPWTYTISGGEATVTGYTGIGGAVTVPESLGGCPVVEMGYGCLWHNATITSLGLPSTLRTIAQSACRDMSVLTSITIPDSVEYIGRSAFDTCAVLASAVIGAGVTEIVVYAFASCPLLTSITFAGLVAPITVGGTWVYDQAATLLGHANYLSDFPAPGDYFYGLHMGNYSVGPPADPNFAYSVSGGEATITSYIGAGGAVTIPATLGGCPVTAIGDNAFNDCDTITSVAIHGGVASIGVSAFEDCDALTSVTLANGLATIGANAFYGTAITSITIPDSVTALPDWCFANCASLASVDLGAGVVTIGTSSFMNCDALATIDFGTALTTIGQSAFEHCSGLVTVTLPDNVTNVGVLAFFQCGALTTVTMGTGVTTIGLAAFKYDTLLDTINFNGLVAPTSVGAQWRDSTAAGLLGHAYAASDFPTPGNVWNSLTMGANL